MARKKQSDDTSVNESGENASDDTATAVVVLSEIDAQAERLYGSCEFLKGLLDDGEKQLAMQAIENINNYKRTTVNQLLEIGSELRAVRHLYPRGSWTLFLNTVGFHHRTAQRYMQASEYAALNADKLGQMTPALLYDKMVEDGNEGEGEGEGGGKTDKRRKPKKAPYGHDMDSEQSGIIEQLAIILAPFDEQTTATVASDELVKEFNRFLKETWPKGSEGANTRNKLITSFARILLATTKSVDDIIDDVDQEELF